MKVAVIVKAEIKNSNIYTTHRSKISYHTDNLFLSEADKNSIEYALGLIRENGGEIDVYTFEKGIVAERILHEALSMGANRAIKFSGVDIYDPLQANIISNQFLNYVRKQGNYDLILTGEDEETDNILARIAYGLGYNYYDYVIKIDNSFNYATALEKGKLNGQIKLPAAVTILKGINTPHLPSFINLRDALSSEINEVKLNEVITDRSKLVADQNKKQQIVFDLNEDPGAVKKLFIALKKDGILK